MRVNSITGVAGPVRSKHLDENSQLKVYLDDDSLIRRDFYEGEIHTIVPAILAVEGVLEGSGGPALLTADVLAKHVGAWNGRPVVLFHPEDELGYVSAAADPRILERRVGTIFEARVENGRLKADLWLNEKQFDALGASNVLAAIVAGEVVELSTGYMSDDIAESGEFRGVEYTVRHVNLKPDHLALLPGQVGACSIADGCGVPRVNTRGESMSTKKISLKDSLSVMLSHLGFKTNCLCEEESMDIKKLAADLKANGSLEAKHLKMLEEMDENQLEMFSILASAVMERGKAAAEGEGNQFPGEEEEEEMTDEQRAAAAAAAKANRRHGKGGEKPLTKEDVAEIVRTNMAEERRRLRAMDTLVGNEACPFDAKELDELPTSHLEKLAKSYHVNDYSGSAGGGGTMVSNTLGDKAYVPPKVVLAPRKKKDAA